MDNTQQTNLIRMAKKTTSRLDHVCTLLRLYVILADIKLSENEILTYAYFVLYGASPATKELLFSSEVHNSEYTYRNMLYKFKKLGLLVKHQKHRYYEIGLDFLKSVGPHLGVAVRLDTGILIELDNR